MSAALVSQAQTTWTAGANTGVYSTAGNWNNGVPSTGPQLSIFDPAALLNQIFVIDVAGTPRNSIGIRFDFTAAANDGFTFSSANASVNIGLQSRAGGTVNGILNNDNSTQTINVPFRMFTSAGGFGTGAAQTINAAAGDIIITGAYPGTSTNATIHNGGGRLTVDGAFNTTIGTTGRGDIIGTNGLTKNGSGTLTLGGTLPNIYTGTTIINSGTVTANKVNALGTGGLMMNGGILNIGANAQTVGGVTNAGGTMNGSATLTGTSYNMISGVVNLSLGGVGVALTKTGAGTVTLNGANSYTGPTRIEEGILRLGASDRIADSSAMQLAGGTFETGGFSEMLGTLDLDLNSTIDFGAGDSDLVFADSDAQDWGSSLLFIQNWTEGVDSIRIGTDGTGFDTQLALFRFADYGNAPGQIDANGFITPVAVPEPSTYVLALLGGLAFWGFFRRRK